MTAKNFADTITANGEYAFPKKTPGKSVILQIKGTFGGGTATPGYDDGAGNFVAYNNDSGAARTCTASDGWVVDLPESGMLAVKLTGATSPSITVSATTRRP